MRLMNSKELLRRVMEEFENEGKLKELKASNDTLEQLTVDE